LTVTSTPGRGSTFTVTIDVGSLRGVRMLDAAAAAATAVRSTSRPVAALRLPAARILVVDDGEANRKLVWLVLQRAGAAVETAENGRVGVDKALAQAFDVILMDMQMPEMDGYAATKLLRERGVSVPIIAFTGHAMKGAADECLAAGCSGYLTKPIDMDLLVRTLSEALSHNQPQREDCLPVEDAQPRSAGVMEYWSDGVLEEMSVSNTPALQHSSTPIPHCSRAPLLSTLPVDDPEFREIVVEFVEKLNERLNALDAAWERRDLAEVARLAHWLKGSGGTAGFAAFTEPARQLHDWARNGQADRIGDAIAELRRLTARIVIPEPVATAGAGVRTGSDGIVE
jgi:CheY-like chemotaxis protein/HPt (histidine-containing phosphotransfer) domain-containing protein